MNKQKNKVILLVSIIALILIIRSSPLGGLFTIENLKQHRESLLLFVKDYYWLSVFFYICLYILVASLSLPGAAVLTLAGGFLFGTPASTLYVNIGATTGASIAFLAARYLLGNRLQEKYQSQLSKFNTEIARSGTSYLLTLRFIPVFPFFLINFLSGLTAVPLRTFIWTTSIGILPGTAVYAFAGQQIGSLNSPSEILSKRMIAVFVVLALFAFIPVLVKRITGKQKR
ncbi:MAG TPA: TVP38/TMEM64 family protein [Nitrospirota bacterium]|nr:TVP38/TMEM64 family protein [Nitrospirota bacterium]